MTSNDVIMTSAVRCWLSIDGLGVQWEKGGGGKGTFSLGMRWIIYFAYEKPDD